MQRDTTSCCGMVRQLAGFADASCWEMARSRVKASEVVCDTALNF